MLSLTLPFRKWRRVCQGLVSYLELGACGRGSVELGRWQTGVILGHHTCIELQPRMGS